MSYYTRILTPSEEWIPIADLQRALAESGLRVRLELVEGTPEKWTQLAARKGDDGLFTLERSTVASGSLGESEIQEFLEEIANCQPASAVLWLQHYLPTIRTIYAFQHLKGMDTDEGRQVFDVIQERLWSTIGGIFQADNEGFSNEDGYHILWQFSERVSGPWSMAVRTKNQRWIRFQMDLGNTKHRASFRAGDVPAGCIPTAE